MAKQITVPLLTAVVRSLGVNAARGQLRSQQAFTKLVFETERDCKAQADQTLEAAIQYKFKWERNSIAGNCSEFRAGSPFLIQTMSILIRTPVKFPSKARRTRQRRPNGIYVSAPRGL